MPISELLITKPLEEVCTSPRFQVRRKINPEHIETLVSLGKWPPIVIGRFETEDNSLVYFVIDGHHRFEAAQQLNLPSIEALVFKGTIDEAVEYAYQSNLRNGLVLTPSEKKTYALKLLQRHPGLSDREIGRQSGLDHKTIANLRRGSPTKPSSSKTSSNIPSDAQRIMGSVMKLDETGYTVETLRDAFEEYLGTHSYEDDSELEHWEDRLRMVQKSLSALING